MVAMMATIIAIKIMAACSTREAKIHGVIVYDFLHWMLLHNLLRM